MERSDVETFLEIVRTRNITKAAAQLFVSQSTVSSRLKNLENELGFALVIRGKGRHTIELTTKGEEFISLAERWSLLHEEAESLRAGSFTRLRVAVNESSYHTRIAPFLLEYGHNNPDLRYAVRICDSEQVYELTNKGLTDFGFASYEADYPRLRVEEIERQELCIISSAHLPETGSRLDIARLDPACEIRFSGGHFKSMEQWREKHHPGAGEPALTVNAGLGALRFFRDAPRWAISPLNMAQLLVRYAPLHIYPLEEQPQPWRMFMLRRRDAEGSRQALFDDFAARLRKHIAADPA